jgi:hypothetical protein
MLGHLRRGTATQVVAYEATEPLARPLAGVVHGRRGAVPIEVGTLESVPSLGHDRSDCGRRGPEQLGNLLGSAALDVRMPQDLLPVAREVGQRGAGAGRVELGAGLVVSRRAYGPACRAVQVAHRGEEEGPEADGRPASGAHLPERAGERLRDQRVGTGRPAQDRGQAASRRNMPGVQALDGGALPRAGTPQ